MQKSWDYFEFSISGKYRTSSVSPVRSSTASNNAYFWSTKSRAHSSSMKLEITIKEIKHGYFLSIKLNKEIKLQHITHSAAVI